MMTSLPRLPVNGSPDSGGPVSKWPCVNNGGEKSQIRLDRTPVLEIPTALPPEAVRALSFWSVRPGGIVSLTDPDETVYRARVVRLSSDEALVVPFEKQACGRSNGSCLTVFQALPQKERFELILEKLTELGVDRIVPFVSRHSITLRERDAGQKKSHRWPEVIKRAAKQCRRIRLPELAPVFDWPEVLSEASCGDLRLMLYEGTCGSSLGELLQQGGGQQVALLIGPEGGFSEQEVIDAEKAGILPVSLGQRILRTETASIVSAAIIQFCLGRLE
jgi:16S rRNA (uracil1498-N3)-methyltransferase